MIYWFVLASHDTKLLNSARTSFIQKSAFFNSIASIAIPIRWLASIFEGMHSIIQLLLSDCLVHRFDCNDKTSLHVLPLIHMPQLQRIVLQNDKSTTFVQYDVCALEIRAQIAFRYSKWWCWDELRESTVSVIWWRFSG